MKQLKSPSVSLVVAPTNSGKSTLILKMVRQREHLYYTFPEKVIICYREWQSMYSEIQKELPNIIFHEGLMTREEMVQWGMYTLHISVCYLYYAYELCKYCYICIF